MGVCVLCGVNCIHTDRQTDRHTDTHCRLQEVINPHHKGFPQLTCLANRLPAVLGALWTVRIVQNNLRLMTVHCLMECTVAPAPFLQPLQGLPNMVMHRGTECRSGSSTEAILSLYGFLKHCNPGSAHERAFDPMCLQERVLCAHLSGKQDWVSLVPALPQHCGLVA